MLIAASEEWRNTSTGAHLQAFRNIRVRHVGLPRLTPADIVTLHPGLHLLLRGAFGVIDAAEP